MRQSIATQKPYRCSARERVTNSCTMPLLLLNAYLVICFSIQLVNAAYHTVTVCQQSPCIIKTHIGDAKAIRVYTNFRIVGISPDYPKLPDCDKEKQFCSLVTRISNVTVHGGPLRDDVSTLYLVAGGDPISNVAVKRNNQDPVFLPRKRKTLPSTIQVDANGMMAPQWLFVRLPLTSDVELSCRNARGVSIARCVDYFPVAGKCAAKKVCISDRNVAGRAQLYGIIPKVPMDIELRGSDPAVEKFVVKLVSDITTTTPSSEVETSTTEEATELSTSSSPMPPPQPTTLTSTTVSTSQQHSTKTPQPVTPKPVEPTKGIITVDTGDKSTSGSPKLLASGFLFLCWSILIA